MKIKILSLIVLLCASRSLYLVAGELEPDSQQGSDSTVSADGNTDSSANQFYKYLMSSDPYKDSSVAGYRFLGKLAHMRVDIPMNSTVLKALLNEATGEGVLDLRSPNHFQNQIGFNCMKSLLQRDDFNANFVKKCIESDCEEEAGCFLAILKLEQKRFIQNMLDQDNPLWSLSKQTYYALIALSLNYFEHCKQFLPIGLIAATVSIIAIILRSGIIHPLYLYVLVLLYAVTRGFVLGSLTFFILNILPSPFSSNNAIHWYQFDIWNMLSKGYDVIKNSIIAAPLVWLSYKSLSYIIAHANSVTAMHNQIASAAQRSLVETTLYALLGRLYNNGQLPQLANNLGMQGV
jgi:hypothetical protein